jgi:hypothetical protein
MALLAIGARMPTVERRLGRARLPGNNDRAVARRCGASQIFEVRCAFLGERRAAASATAAVTLATAAVAAIPALALMTTATLFGSRCRAYRRHRLYRPAAGPPSPSAEPGFPLPPTLPILRPHRRQNHRGKTFGRRHRRRP